MKNVKFIFQLVSQFKGWYFFILGVLLVQTAASISAIGIQQYIIDSVFMQGNFDEIFGYLFYLLVAVLVSATAITVNGYTYHLVLFRMRYYLYERTMRFIHNIPIFRFQQERIALYVDVLNKYVMTSAVAIGFRLPQGFYHVFNALVLMVIIGWSSLPILIAVFCFSFLYLFLGYYFGPKLKGAAQEVNTKRRDLVLHLEEGISSTREVIAFHRHEYEASAYQRMFGAYFTKILSEGKTMNQQMIISQPLRWGANLSILIFGGIGVMQGHMSIGHYIVLYQFATQLMRSYDMIFQFFMQYSGYMASIENLRLFYDNEQMEEGTLSLKQPVNRLEFDKVSFRYKENMDLVFDELDFSIPIGSKVAFVGSSGAGKSTIAQLLIRFYDPTEGSIRINGIELNSINRADWGAKLTIVFQTPYLFPDTIRKNLTFGRDEGTDERIEWACRMAEIHEFIMGLPNGYETEVGERGIMLSGGQRQRIAMARALLANTDILILDEATSSLDLTTERKVMNNIDQIREGLTTIIIAHRLSTIQNADLIYVLDHGKIVEQGTHAELMSFASKYRSMVAEEHESRDDLGAVG